MGTNATDEARKQLERVGHIIVLMMENRSFDHMLGYLTLEGGRGDLDGLKAEMGNKDSKGIFHPVAPIGKRIINQKVLDPGHDVADVTEQLADNNGGFVINFEKILEKQKVKFPPKKPVDLDPTLVVGYQQAKDLPVYDYIARNWLICDRWFSSVPGPTWRNRMYAMTGGEGKATLLGKIPGPLKGAPIFDRPAFVRWLEEKDWRWYSHDPATLRMADSRYRPGGEGGSGSDANFAYFNRRTLFEWNTFLNDAEHDKLPKVSWVDPNFVDFRLFGPPGSNDDHPPAPVMMGQELILTLLVALTKSKAWEKCLLIITYDEHGGFYDHVVPPAIDLKGDPYRHFGVRVPALVISPFVAAGASSHVVFDHTSITKTILLAFSGRADEALAALGPRTQAANHLGALLTPPGTAARPPAAMDDLQHLADVIAKWKIDAYPKNLLEPPTTEEKMFDAVSELQRDIIGNALQLRADGLPPGQP